jgi:hypothetical protein
VTCCVLCFLLLLLLLLQVGLTVLQYLVWVVQANIAAAQGGTGATHTRHQQHLAGTSGVHCSHIYDPIKGQSAGHVGCVCCRTNLHASTFRPAGATAHISSLLTAPLSLSRPHVAPFPHIPYPTTTPPPPQAPPQVLLRRHWLASCWTWSTQQQPTRQQVSGNTTAAHASRLNTNRRGVDTTECLVHDRLHAWYCLLLLVVLPAAASGTACCC